MKKINPLKLTIGILGLSTAASLVGSISGTIAWYAYSTRALVSYTGTSAQSSAQLQIGLKVPERVQLLDEDPLLDDPIEENGYFYYFTHLGSGGMPSSVINKYLGGSGFASTSLEPVSTYSYDGSKQFKLKNCPTTNNPDERSDAPTSKYVRIPFAFRVFATGVNGLATTTSIPNKEVFLSSAVAQVTSEKLGIGKAIRLFVDREGALADYIFNPNASTDGATKTAGVLDLSGNGYYDYDNNPGNNNPRYLREFIYGDYTFKNKPNLDVKYGWNDFVDQGVADSLYHDINETGVDMEEEGFSGTTFTAKHRRGTMHLDYSHGEQLEDYIDYGTASYLGTGSVFPNKTNGVLSGNNYVCKTAESEVSAKNIGSFDLTVYIEGWDHATINQHGNEYFNLGLTFEIGANNS